MRHAVECDGYFVHRETALEQKVKRININVGLLVFVTVSQKEISPVHINKTPAARGRRRTYKTLVLTVLYSLYGWAVSIQRYNAGGSEVGDGRKGLRSSQRLFNIQTIKSARHVVSFPIYTFVYTIHIQTGCWLKTTSLSVS